MHGIFFKCTGFLANARDFFQLHEIFGKCTRFFFNCTGFLANARGFFQLHEIFDKCTGFFSIARGFWQKFEGRRQKYAMWKQNTWRGMEICGVL